MYYCGIITKSANVGDGY